MLTFGLHGGVDNLYIKRLAGSVQIKNFDGIATSELVETADRHVGPVGEEDKVLEDTQGHRMWGDQAA